MMVSMLLEIVLLPLIIASILSVGVFFVGFRLFKDKFYPNTQETILTDVDEPILEIDEIAGDNVWSTKLDLARAYLETGQSALAKSVILEVANCNDDTLKNEANVLLQAHF